MRTHEAAAERHAKAARHWSELGDEERAGFERRAVGIERELIELERDMARVARKRPIATSSAWDACVTDRRRAPAGKDALDDNRVRGDVEFEDHSPVADS